MTFLCQANSRRNTGISPYHFWVLVCTSAGLSSFDSLCEQFVFWHFHPDLRELPLPMKFHDHASFLFERSSWSNVTNWSADIIFCCCEVTFPEVFILFLNMLPNWLDTVTNRHYSFRSHCFPMLVPCYRFYASVIF